MEEDNTDKWLKAKGSVYDSSEVPRDCPSSHSVGFRLLGERIRNRELYGDRETRVYRTGPYRGQKNYMGWMLAQTKLNGKPVRS